MLDKLLKQNRISIPKGVHPSGAMSEWVSRLYGLIRESLPAGVTLTVDPGDMVRIGKGKTPDIILAAPVAFDVWYLWKTVNFLPDGKTESENYVNGRLSFLADNMGGIKPLRVPVNRSDIRHYEQTYWTKGYFENDAPYYIHLMIYEVRRQDQEFVKGENEPFGDHHAYLAFEVGQMGVMRVISIFGESDTDGVSLSGPSEGGGMFPPTDDMNNDCFGVHLIENGWDKVADRAEYSADIVNIRPHYWMRYSCRL